MTFARIPAQAAWLGCDQTDADYQARWDAMSTLSGVQCPAYTTQALCPATLIDALRPSYEAGYCTWLPAMDRTYYDCDECAATTLPSRRREGDPE